jgi:pyrroline-5-carboxylate reductase
MLQQKIQQAAKTAGLGQRIGFIGNGKMTEALVGGLLNS